MQALKPVHNDIGVVNNINELLREFSLSTQKQFEELSGLIEDANKSGLLDPENYEQLLKREGFDNAYHDLVEESCMTLCMKMYNYLEDLENKMKEYHSISM